MDADYQQAVSVDIVEMKRVQTDIDPLDWACLDAEDRFAKTLEHYSVPSVHSSVLAS